MALTIGLVRFEVFTLSPAGVLGYKVVALVIAWTRG